MKCGGDVPKISKKPVDLGPVDAVTGPRVNTPAEKKCLAKYNGYVKTVGPELRSKSMICRGAALNYMWRAGDVKNLAASLRSDIADVRETSFRHLKAIMSNKPTPKQIQTLVRALSRNKHNNLVRTRIIAALSLHVKVRRNGRLRKKLASSLRKILDPNSKELRESKILALKSLGRLHAKETLPEILKTMRGDEDIQVRIAAVNVCIQISPRNSEKVIQALVETGKSIKSKITLKTEDTTEKIAKKTITEVYKEVMSTHVVPDLDAALNFAMYGAADRLNNSPNVLLYASIVRALGYFRASTEDAMDLITYGIHSPIWSLRKSAASALTRVNHTDTLKLLGQAIQSESRKGIAWTNFKKIHFLTKAYRETASLADRADRRNVAHYARKFEDKKSSSSDRLVWIANLKELGSKRALMLLLKVRRNEKEFAEVRKAAKEILDEKMPQHVFIPEKPEVEKKKAYSGPPTNTSWVPSNLG